MRTKKMQKKKYLVTITYTVEVEDTNLKDAKERGIEIYEWRSHELIPSIKVCAK